MRFPSIKTITDGLKNTIKRFPFELLFALIGTIAGIILIELSDVKRETESWCLRLIMMANLGLLLSLAATLFIESKEKLPAKPIIIRSAAALFAVLLILIIDPYYEMADRIRFFLLSLSFHLLVSFAAFTAKGHVQGFWQFNKALFLRFLEGALYSVVLFAGISAALAAMNFLFKFKFEWDTFVILWTIIVGLFQTTFVLSGIPQNTPALDADDSYPKSLKIFTQYVLIPLATVYVAILLSYEAKILIQWDLPKGLVSVLILSYAVFGILSILLVYPIREREENKWIKTYARSFYFLLVPLIVLLLFAVGTRVFKYGITEGRYFLIVLAGWLLFITLYFLLSKKQNIKLIPISLCVITLLTVYGPQSTFSISKYSQQQVLVKIFQRNHAFKDGKLLPVDSTKISRKDGNRAVSTMRYLVDHHDLISLQPYLSADLAKVSDSLGKAKQQWNEAFEVDRYELQANKLYWLKRYLHLGRFRGIEYPDISEDDESLFINNTFNAAERNTYKISGFDYVMDMNLYTDTLKDRIDNLDIRQHNADSTVVKLSINSETLVFEYRDQLERLIKDNKLITKFKNEDVQAEYQNIYDLPAKLLLMTRENNHYKVTLRVNTVSFSSSKELKIARITFMNGQYLIKVK